MALTVRSSHFLVVFNIILCAYASTERDCIALQLDKSVSDSLLNDTILSSRVTSDSEDVVIVDIVELWDSFPKIVVPSNGSSEVCRRDGQLFMDSLKKLELWALQMFDATAKLPSGILSGNGNQYGDFDECLNIRANVGNEDNTEYGVTGNIGEMGNRDDTKRTITGQYCLASLQVTLEGNARQRHIDNMLHSGHYIRSNLTDMGHRLPRYSSLLWGICIPSSCSSYDLEDELTLKLATFGITPKVHDTMCTTKNFQRPYSLGRFFTIIFFSVIALLISLGTMLDDGIEGATDIEKLLNAFSLKRNFRRLFDLSDSANRVKGVDAFRGLNALALLMAHKSMAMAHNAYVNKTSFSAVFGMPWAVLGRSAIVYTDSFLYLSGFLNAYNLLGELQKKGTIDVKSRLLARWFRLFPLFLCLMLFCTYILPDINNGPQWNLVVEEHGRQCQKNMWRSFLFIHNYFGLEDMCLTHTHQIGLDMQLYIATLPLMIILWKNRTLGWTLVVAAATASTVIRYMAIYWYDISMFVYYGISVQKLLDAARYSYILPTHRATIYLMGVIMAYLIKFKDSHIVLTKNQTKLLWASCFALAAFTIASPYEMGLEGYKYEHLPAALFAAFSPILWGLFMSLAHWGICNGYAGSAFVDCKVFKLFNKIAYGVYLTQFPIFFYNVGVQRHSDYYTPLKLFHIPEVMVVVVISAFTTVAIEMPFYEIYRIYFDKTQRKIKKN